MPINKYFGGHGTDVMRQMVASHGKEAGKSEFYATANDRGGNPPGENKKAITKVDKLKKIKKNKKFGKNPDRGINHGPNFR